jgi:hypothetical protein
MPRFRRMSAERSTVAWLAATIDDSSINMLVDLRILGRRLSAAPTSGGIAGRNRAWSAAAPGTARPGHARDKALVDDPCCREKQDQGCGTSDEGTTRRKGFWRERHLVRLPGLSSLGLPSRRRLALAARSNVAMLTINRQCFTVKSEKPKVLGFLSIWLTYTQANRWIKTGIGRFCRRTAPCSNVLLPSPVAAETVLRQRQRNRDRHP